MELSTDREEGLEGLTFYDNLSEVGEYIAESFTVGENSVDDEAVYDSDEYSLSYTFSGDNATAAATITFETKLTDEERFGTSNVSKANIAYLRDGENDLADDGDDVTYEPKWIEKNTPAGSSAFDIKNMTVTWVITANHNGLSLSDVEIHDALPEGLTFESATLKEWNTANEKWDDASLDDQPTYDVDDDEYKFALGDISTKIQIEIVAKIENLQPANPWDTGTFNNEAWITWQGGPEGGVGSGEIGAGVTYNNITKSGTQISTDGSSSGDKEPIIEWTVGVQAHEADLENLTVYDLLIYGEDFDVNHITASEPPLDLPEDLPLASIADRTGKNRQRYYSVDEADLTFNVYTLTDSNGNKADLLVVSGFSTTNGTLVYEDTPGNGDNNNYYQFTFKFRSLVLDPEIFASNSNSKKVENTAAAFDANGFLKNASASVTYNSNVLKKKMLERSSAVLDDGKKVTNPNDVAENVKNGFNYVDKTVVFRILVNEDNYNLSNRETADGTPLGDITLRDTLPKGWVFVDIDNPENTVNDIDGTFRIHRYVANTAGEATGTATLFDAKVVTAGSDTESAIAEYTFTVDKPYVILIRAKLTDEAYEAALLPAVPGNSQHSTFTNEAQLWAKNKNISNKAEQRVQIEGQFVEKLGAESQDRTIQWTVDYKPYDLNIGGTYIVDELSESIEPIIDSSGQLILSETVNGAEKTYISVRPLTLYSNGTYGVGEPLDIEVGEVEINDDGEIVTMTGGVAYDPVTRFLVFKIDEPDKAYRFEYTTDITGSSGTISNTVKLYGVEYDNIEIGDSDEVQNIDYNAGGVRKPWIRIRKVDADNGIIDAPATFTLYAINEAGERGNVIRQGTTSNGLITMRQIPVGSYILKETEAPNGYQLDDNEYHLVTYLDEDSNFVYEFSVKVGENLIRIVTDSESPNTLTVMNFKHGTANLTISKSVPGGDKTKKFTFTVSFYNIDDEELVGSTFRTFVDGFPDEYISSGGTVSLADGESIMIVGLEPETSYQVVENNYAGEGYSVYPSGGVISGTVPVEFDATLELEAAFRNTYVASGSWVPEVTKELIGRNLKDKEFSFVLKDSKGNVLQTAQNNANGRVTFNSISYDRSDIGSHYYTITEVAGNEPGMSYDTRSIRIDVRVSDTGGGSLGIDISYPQVSKFTNRFGSGPDAFSITAKKVWEDLPSGWETELPTIWFKLLRSVEGGSAEAIPGVGLKKLPVGTTQVSWSGLEKYNADGKLYVYSVQEVDENGKDWEPKHFDKTENGLTVTNAFNKEKVDGDEDFEKEVDITGHKVWEGVPKGQTVPTIWLRLYRHVEGGVPEVVADRPLMELRPGVTKGTWTELEKFDEDYNYYIYTVKEVDNKGKDWEPSNYIKSEEGLTVTNRHTPKAPVTGENLSVLTILGALFMAISAVFLLISRRKIARTK